MAPFVYLNNLGNLGDLLIAEGTRQRFAKLKVEWREYDENNLPDTFNLVFAGGAKITKEWGTASKELPLLTDKKINRCLILPHSINGADDFLANLDARYVLALREKYSLAYCREHALKVAEMHLFDDMAINLDMEQVKRECVDLSSVRMQDLSSDEEKKAFKMLQNGFADKLKSGVRSSTVSSLLGNEMKRIAFLMRQDKEAAGLYPASHTFDISSVWYTTGKAMRFNTNILLAFSDAMKEADVIVTDRLHVAIMAWHSGREVYMLDNSYKKLSGVYEQSLSGESKVHLIREGVFPWDLDIAWTKLFIFKHIQRQNKKLDELEHKLMLSLFEKKYKTRYRYCRLMSLLSWGKKKARYEEQRRQLATKLALMEDIYDEN